MNAKTDTAFFESIVTEALAKMKAATSGASSYEVHRSSGQLTVRRGAEKADRNFTNVSDYALVADLKPAE